MVDGVVHVRPQHPQRRPSSPQGLLTDAELAGGASYRAASLRRAGPITTGGHDFEREQWFRADGYPVGSGRGRRTWRGALETQLDGERIRNLARCDGTLDAQARRLTGARRWNRQLAGLRARLLHPLHAALDRSLGISWSTVKRFRLRLAPARSPGVYNVHANWKLIVENYSSAPPLPGIPPQG